MKVPPGKLSCINSVSKVSDIRNPPTHGVKRWDIFRLINNVNVYHEYEKI